MFWSVSTVEENAERRVRIAKREFAREYEQKLREAEQKVRKETLAEDKARYSALVTKLAREGRLEELAAAVEDSAKLDALFAELT